LDGKLKQRVIGVVVLTALAVIILPLLLDGTEQERERIVQGVPAIPTLEVVDLDPKAMIAEMDRIEADSKARLPGEVEPTDDIQTSQSSLDANGLPNGWSLQVGSFAETANAFQLRDKLRKKGFRTYAIGVVTDAGEHVRVMVGPSLQRSRIEQIKAQIEADFDLVGKIVRYSIEDDSRQLGG
jgi:DedD protein